ncbi:MAG TPA: peptidylprolyl isomerase [Patescibacteria group bacterium]|nr:peptidylprolyl isomerase [Patescibacteria group bacterium]
MKGSWRTVISAALIVLFIGSSLASLASMFWEKEKLEVAVLETSMGKTELELNRDAAPMTVKNFVAYVEEGFYDGKVFHRVIPGFMIQCGGFFPNGTEAETRDPIVLESGNGLSNLKGTVAMARLQDPDSATSQFYINLVDNGYLDRSSNSYGYAVFGKVVKGWEVVEDIAGVTTGVRDPFEDWPVRDVVIERAYMKK